MSKMYRYEMAITIIVRQDGVDGNDALDRALWNLKLRNAHGNNVFHEPHPFEDSGHNKDGMGVTVRRYEHVMSKEVKEVKE